MTLENIIFVAIRIEPEYVIFDISSWTCLNIEKMNEVIDMYSLVAN